MAWQLSPAVIISEVQSEAVLLNVTSGNCFVLDSLSLAICKLIEAECDMADVVEYLQNHFPAEAAHIPQDIQEFIDALLAEGLIIQKE
jgi:hypothetical protein